MASSGFAALGTTLTFNSVQVKELTNVNIPLGTTSEIDITNHDSPDDYKEFVMGLLDGGEISFEGNFVPSDSGQQGLVTAFQARTSAAFTVTLPDSGSCTFTGTAYVKSFNVSAPVEGKASLSGSLRVTGKVTMTP